MLQRNTVDPDVGTNGYVRAGNCRDGLDERGRATGARPLPKISPRQPEIRQRARWRTYEDQIANGDRPIRRDNLPEAERLARGQIDAQTGQNPHADKRGHERQTNARDGEVASPGLLPTLLSVRPLRFTALLGGRAGWLHRHVVGGSQCPAFWKGRHCNLIP